VGLNYIDIGPIHLLFYQDWMCGVIVCECKLAVGVLEIIVPIVLRVNDSPGNTEH